MVRTSRIHGGGDLQGENTGTRVTYYDYYYLHASTTYTNTTQSNSNSIMMK